MKLRADDDIYRARMVYLGPPGYPLPWHWTYGRWALCAVLSVVFVGAVLLLTGFTWNLGPIGFAEAAAMVTTAVVWRRVNPDRRARAVIRTALTDWRAYPKPGQDRVALPRLSTTHITIKEQP